MARMLIVDDDAAVRDSIQTLLGLDGHEVIEAEDGRQGEAAIKRHRPDVVIIDIFMPQQDGFETIRSLRRTYGELKILAISGAAEHRFGRALLFAQEFGADAVLEKPFQSDALRSAIRSLLEPDARQANG
jgi:CheY-like chemotaxis protein